MLRKIIIGALVTASASSFACTADGVKGIAPKNNLWISHLNKSSNGMTEEIFNKVLDRIDDIYRPIVDAEGQKLVINRLWKDGTVNASAQQIRWRRTWKINMYGGLARHEEATADAFAMVACHEMGHHIGGAPKKPGFFRSSWASNEGQSDYWAAMKCFRKYVEQDDNQALTKTMSIPTSVTEKCAASFSRAEDIAICERGSMAGQALARLLGSLQGLNVEKIKFDTPDQSVVTRTFDAHPQAQCRLDSYFAGALCNIDAYADVDQKDPNLNVCSRSNGDTVGVRPLCWYKP